MPSSRSVILAGATGLVGDEILHQLLGDPDVTQIHVVTRRPIAVSSPKIIVHQSQDLTVTHWQPEWAVPLQGYIALGTTKKIAGSNKALEDIDLHLVVKVARMMAVMGVKHVSVVSSMFAHPWSPSHYLRCKGKMERALSDMGFERLLVARPGPLLGQRDVERKDEQMLQRIMPIFKPFLAGPFADVEPVEAVRVARGMIHALTEQNWPGRLDMRILPGRVLTLS
ncbi:nucleoside-diphosphate sugar epimerase [Enterovibrio norvegicus]|uniref:nucleoside-diphosphate sugar epimerase n=1 Tax=Enterovibrio norvegicus TaxID=188144 RepID=UPI000C817EFC|nr:nucleoside-diphosphate sugar epimerase [Enterovibrio norvegicus]PMN73733.1 nucleoside-diphosphate sugar epimerase [Enterovibrio norvegicus]